MRSNSWIADSVISYHGVFEATTIQEGINDKAKGKVNNIKDFY